ncbi:hypothetical protein VCV18_006323 [Metarhizium anisopliae]
MPQSVEKSPARPETTSSAQAFSSWTVPCTGYGRYGSPGTFLSTEIWNSCAAICFVVLELRALGIAPVEEGAAVHARQGRVLVDVAVSFLPVTFSTASISAMKLRSG